VLWGLAVKPVPFASARVAQTQPGTAGNPVNPTKDVEIPVAILSTRDFYAPILQPIVPGELVRIVSVAADAATVARGFAFKTKGVDGDGLRGLIVRFIVAGNGIVCRGSTEAVPHGFVIGGPEVEGTVNISLKGCK
jgi:hypothetical protein